MTRAGRDRSAHRAKLVGAGAGGRLAARHARTGADRHSDGGHADLLGGAGAGTSRAAHLDPRCPDARLGGALLALVFMDAAGCLSWPNWSPLPRG